MDEEFGRYTKFYRYDYFMNKWGRIEVGLPKYEGMREKKVNCETLVAMYLRVLIAEFKSICENSGGGGTSGSGNSGGEKNMTLN